MGRKKKEKDFYWNEETDEQLIKFINSDSEEERNKIYNKYLKIPFKKMVSSILRKYPIHLGSYDIMEVEKNGLSHLIENIKKFDPNLVTKTGKKAKAYSYAGTITRNYFKYHSRTTYKDLVRNLNYDDFSEEIETNSDYIYEMSEIDEEVINNPINNLILELIKSIKEKIEREKKEMTEDEIKIGMAIIEVFENVDSLFLENSDTGNYNKRITNNFTKSKIFLYLKEITNLNTKEVREALKAYKELYYLTKTDFFNNQDEY
ncbi:MAG: hypothetical protein ACOC33_00025 [bacterium]